MPRRAHPSGAAGGILDRSHDHADHLSAGRAGGRVRGLGCQPVQGCGHQCRYCWVPHYTYQRRIEFDKGANYREGFLEELAKKAARMQSQGICPQCLLCFSTDPYHAGDTMPTRETMKILAAHGMGFNPLSKGGTRALRDLDLYRVDRDAYATTLISRATGRLTRLCLRSGSRR